VNCLPALEQRFTLDGFERIWAASHVVLRWVGNVVQLLEEAVLRVDEPNIAELHVTRAVYGSSVSQRGELLNVQTPSRYESNEAYHEHRGNLKVNADGGP
jgi:hypothetical protein